MDTSIVIASHNEGPALGQTIESCAETMTGCDYEVVVADDASADGSVDMAQQRFPLARIVRHDRRQGASAAKALGARHARGDVLVFLDAHTRPEPGAISRLVRAAGDSGERAIVTPAIAALDARRWRTDADQVGHGYGMDLKTFGTRWMPLEEMRRTRTRTGFLFESPSLIGCAFAVSRDLYEELRGFDPQMQSWGIEDLDLGLKCWQLGHRILHDPDVIIGHRFQSEFGSYEVPAEHVLVNKMRMARKNFTPAVWAQWLAACREEHPGPLAGHPEGLWAHAWQLLQASGPGLEQERSYLHARRARDEFWYAERFGLSWPRLAGTGAGVTGAAAGPGASPAPSSQPSPSPRPAPAVEIQVNNTATAADDLVLLSSQHPARQPAVSCQIRLTSTEPGPVTVVLHDPAGRLAFPSAASVTLTLPASRAFVSFQITGQMASTAIGDALVEARAGSLSGPVAARRPVTVVSFGQAQMTLAQGGSYAIVGTSYTVPGFPAAHAVDFTAQASIQPAGVDCTAPQLKNIRVAIMQEISNLQVVRTWNNPAVNFNASAPHKFPVTMPVTIGSTVTLAASVQQPVNDGANGAFPLYDNGALAMTIPAGCANSGPAKSNDTPSAPFPATFSFPVVTAGGTTIGTALWQSRVKITRTNHFRTYCVAFDTQAKTFTALREATWDLALDSSQPAQRAQVHPDAPAASDPVATLPQFNHAAMPAATAAVGAATLTITSP